MKLKPTSLVMLQFVSKLTKSFILWQTSFVQNISSLEHFEVTAKISKKLTHKMFLNKIKVKKFNNANFEILSMGQIETKFRD